MLFSNERINHKLPIARRFPIKESPKFIERLHAYIIMIKHVLQEVFQILLAAAQITVPKGAVCTPCPELNSCDDTLIMKTRRSYIRLYYKTWLYKYWSQTMHGTDWWQVGDRLVTDWWPVVRVSVDSMTLWYSLQPIFKYFLKYSVWNRWTKKRKLENNWIVLLLCNVTRPWDIYQLIIPIIYKSLFHQIGSTYSKITLSEQTK
jgi:hypothetical protein